MRKKYVVGVFLIGVLLTLFSITSFADENSYCNGSDMFANDNGEFFSNIDNEDKLYCKKTPQSIEIKVLDKHIMSMVSDKNNNLYLLAYEGTNTDLISFNTETYEYNKLCSFGFTVTNISMREDKVYMKTNVGIQYYDIKTNTIGTIIENTNIDFIYFKDFNTLLYYSKNDNGTYDIHTYLFDKAKKTVSSNSISLMSASSYSPRLSEPATNNAYYTSLNVFHTSGYGMVDGNGNKRGNCTCYAYGRSYENLGYKPSLCTGNAGTWYSYNVNNGFYSYGKTPYLGAVAVWSKTGAAGHVAVVEVINGDTVITSESGWNSFYFKTVTRSASNYNFSANSSYNFLGFIYVCGKISTAPSYADLGDDFYAVILNTEHWKTISLEDDQSVKIRPEDGTSKQVWRFKKQSDGSYLILSAKTGKALELYAGETADGTPVKACSEDWGGNYQRWYLYPQGNGYCIVSKHYSDTKNIAMDLSAAAAYDGTSVIGWKRYNGASQIWSIYSAQDVQLTAPNFSVNVDTSNQQAKFTWSEVYGESNYSVKIWKDKLYEGNAYKVCDTAVSGYSVSLPAGTYYAYVDAGNYFGWKQSNVVSFTVKATYKITYNANGGSNVPLSQIKVQNSPLKLSENSPSRSGYSFKGWNTKPDGSGTNYAPGASYSANSAITLYAQWTEHLNIEPGIYKIHSAVNDNMVFDIEGDSKESGANIQLYKNDDNPVKYFRLIKYTDYYVIQSVYSGMFLDIHTPIEDASNIWLYKTYTNPEEKWVFEDAGDGYVYIRSITGYYVDIDGNRAENHVNVLAYHFTGNTVQKWRLERQYTISYNANDGNSVPSSQTKAQNISIKLSESIPSRLGYSFIGWNTISDGSGIFYSPGDTYSENADITLYAQWKKIEPSTSSTVKQIDNGYIVNIEFINVQNGKTVICAGYKENRFVTAQIEEYSENFNPIILTGDIDTVKIMIWDDVSNIMPVTKVEEIPSSKWVKEQI